MQNGDGEDWRRDPAGRGARAGAPTLGRAGLADLDLLEPFKAVAARLVAPNAAALGAVAALSLVAFGTTAFGHLLAYDDWPQMVEHGFGRRVPIENGRWLHAATLALPGGDLVAPAATLFAMLALWWLALLHLVDAAGPRGRLTAFLVLALFTFHPVTAEMAGVEITHLAAGLAVLLTTLAGTATWRLAGSIEAGAPARRRAGLFAAGAALFAAGAAAFQQFAVLVPMTVALLLALAALEDPARAAAPRRLICVGAVTLAVSAAGLALYYVSTLAAFGLTGVSPPSGGHYDVAGGFTVEEFQSVAAFRRFASHVAAFLALPQHAIPMAAKALVLAMLAAAGLHAVRTWRRAAASDGALRGALAGAVVAGATAVLVLGPWLLGLTRVSSLYYYTALTPLALTWAGVFLIAVSGFRRALGRSAVQLAALGVVAISVHQHNAASVVTGNNNRRDVAVAQRMVERIERMDRFAELERASEARVLVLGRVDWPESKVFDLGAETWRMGSSAVECGLVNCRPRQLAEAMTAMQTRRVRYRGVEARQVPERERLVTGRTLRGMRPWPDDDAIRITENGLVLIRLPDPREDD